MDGIKFKTEDVELELDPVSSDVKSVAVALEWEMNISFTRQHIHQLSLYVPEQKIVFWDDNCSMQTVVIPELWPTELRFDGKVDIFPSKIYRCMGQWDVEFAGVI